MHLYFFPYGDMSNWKWGGGNPLTRASVCCLRKTAVPYRAGEVRPFRWVTAALRCDHLFFFLIGV